MCPALGHQAGDSLFKPPRPAEVGDPDEPVAIGRRPWSPLNARAPSLSGRGGGGARDLGCIRDPAGTQMRPAGVQVVCGSVYGRTPAVKWLTGAGERYSAGWRWQAGLMDGAVLIEQVIMVVNGSYCLPLPSQNYENQRSRL